MKEAMSTAEILSLLSTIFFVVAAICLALAVFFWFWFRIPTVIGDLSGKNAKKSIARMRASNENSGNKSYRTSQTNAERGKLTGVMDENVKQKKSKAKKKEDEMPETGLLAENKASNEISEATALLTDEEATGILIDEDSTAVLEEQSREVPKREGGKILTMIEEVMLIHTDEVI